MNKDNKKKMPLLIGVFVMLFCLLVVCVYVGYRFLKHEYRQQDRITSLEYKLSEIVDRNEALEIEIETLEQNISSLKSYVGAESRNWSVKNYNYLAIGNSITQHPKCDYWWNECGMAASTLENDYVHQLTKLVEGNEYFMSGGVLLMFPLSTFTLGRCRIMTGRKHCPCWTAILMTD